MSKAVLSVLDYYLAVFVVQDVSMACQGSLFYPTPSLYAHIVSQVLFINKIIQNICWRIVPTFLRLAVSIYVYAKDEN